MCEIEDSAWLKGLQRWIIFRAPSGLGATMPVGGWILSCRITYELSSSRSGSFFFLLALVYTGLDGSVGATTTPGGAFSSI